MQSPRPFLIIAASCALCVNSTIVIAQARQPTLAPFATIVQTGQITVTGLTVDLPIQINTAQIVVLGVVNDLPTTVNTPQILVIGLAAPLPGVIDTAAITVSGFSDNVRSTSKHSVNPSL